MWNLSDEFRYEILSLKVFVGCVFGFCLSFNLLMEIPRIMSIKKKNILNETMAKEHFSMLLSGPYFTKVFLNSWLGLSKIELKRWEYVWLKQFEHIVMMASI